MAISKARLKQTDKDLFSEKSVREIQNGKKAGQQQTSTMISIADLSDNPNNNEPVAIIEDLVASIRTNGFAVPIEVTDYGMPAGKYMILSGHRRKTAAQSIGMTELPCLIKTFSDEVTMARYCLSMNAHRNTENDPTQLVRRTIAWAVQLRKEHFRGSVVTEIAQLEGISPAQAQRFLSFEKAVPEVLELIETNVCGISSLAPLCIRPAEAQTEILAMLDAARADGKELSRDLCKAIYTAYDNGNKTYEAYLATLAPAAPIEVPFVLSTPSDTTPDTTPAISVPTKPLDLPTKALTESVPESEEKKPLQPILRVSKAERENIALLEDLDHALSDCKRSIHRLSDASPEYIYECLQAFESRVTSLVTDYRNRNK